MRPDQVRKREGTLVPFDPNRIEEAVRKAAWEVLKDEDRYKIIASSISDAVIQRIEGAPEGAILSVEAIQELVETVPISNKKLGWRC